MGQVILDYFTDIFSSSKPSDFTAAFGGFDHRVSGRPNEVLVAKPTGGGDIGCLVSDASK